MIGKFCDQKKQKSQVREGVAFLAILLAIAYQSPPVWSLKKSPKMAKTGTKSKYNVKTDRYTM